MSPVKRADYLVRYGGLLVVGTLLVCLLVAVLWVRVLSPAASAQAAEPPVSAPKPKQFYTGWHYHREKGYWYRQYLYLGSDATKTYERQWVICPASYQPQWLYFFEPERQRFWLRVSTRFHPDYPVHRPAWCVLAGDFETTVTLTQALQAPWGHPIPAPTLGGRDVDFPPNDIPEDGHNLPRP